MTTNGVNGEPLVPDEVMDLPRLLIVDDDKDAADALGEVLARRGYEVRTAYDASDAHDAVAAFAPEIALVDVRLGRDNGIDLIDELTLKRPQLFCVVMTAYADLDVAIRAVRHGVYDFFRKPIDLDPLDAALGRAYEVVRLKREKEHAQHQLEQSEKNYRTLFESATGGIGRTRLSDSKVLLANRKLAEMFGYDSAEEFIDDFVFSEHYVNPDDQSRLLAHYQQSPDQVTEVSFSKRDGSIITVAAAGRINQEDGYVDFVAIDITERKQAEEEKDRLVQAVENLAEGVVLFDKEDRIVFSNKAFQELNEAIIEYTQPGTLFEDHLRAIVRAGIVVDAIGREDEWVEDRMRHHLNPKGLMELSRSDGKTVLVNEQVLPDLGTVLVISDVTELKQAQAQVIQASKLATLGEMATSIAHELNQPLHVIRLVIGNVIRKLEKGNADPAYLGDKLERIASHTERAAAIIDHMRIFGRKTDEPPHEMDPRDIVKSALELMGEELRLADIDVSLDLPETCPPVSGHRVQLEQVILNLLANARDAIKRSPAKGGRKITLAVGDSDDNTVRITVSDTGGGIPDNVLPRIFDPFFTTKGVGEGTGLGLSVGYGIIRDMGGAIEAENADGGAKFTITLLVAEKGSDAGHIGSKERRQRPAS